MEFFLQRHRHLAGHAQHALAIGPVGGDFKIDNRVVQVQHLAHIGAGRPFALQDENAVHLRAGIVPFFQAELLPGAEHPIRDHAPQLALFDVHPVGKMGVVKGGGHQGPLKNVVRAGDDLHRFVLANVDLADLQFIGVRMFLQLGDPAYHHTVHGGGQILDAFHLEAAHHHFIAQLLHRHVDVHIPLEPA